MKQEKYVITAVSRLTGEREVISAPKQFMTAQEMCARWRRKFARQRDPVYSLLKVESADREGRLF